MKYFHLLLFSFFFTLSFGQDLRLINYQVEHGLPTNLTKTIAQDDKEFIWIGTDMGLLRFDGKTFVHFSKSLPSDYVKHILKRKNGDLLVATDLGITQVHNQTDTVIFASFINGSQDMNDTTVHFPKLMYEDKHQNLWVSEPQSVVKIINGKLIRYRFPGKCNTSSFLRAFLFAEDKFGTLWIASHQGYIFRYDPQKDTFFEIETPVKFASIQSIISNHHGNIWIAEDGLVYELIPQKNDEYTISPSINLPNVSTIIEDQDKNFFFGTWYKGLYSVKEKNGNYSVNKINELPYKVINSIFAQNSHELWVCSDEGLALLHKPFFAKIPFQTPRSYVQAIHKTSNGEIYTTEGGSIMKIIKSGNRLITEDILSFNEKEIIMSVAQQGNTLWFGTSSGNLYKYENSQIQKQPFLNEGRPVFNLVTDKDNNLWVCQHQSPELIKITPENKVFVFGKKHGLTSPILTIKQNSKGTIYCGGLSDKNYLFKYDENSDQFTNISKPLPFTISGILSIDDMCIDQSDNIWMASNHGLLLQNDEKIKKVLINEDDETYKIRAIGLSKDDELWIGTNLGLLKYTHEQFISFDEFNGLPSKTITYRCIQFTKDNQILIGTIDGIGYSQFPSYLLKTTPTPVFLNLVVNNQRIHADAQSKEWFFKSDAFLQANFITPSFPSGYLTYQYRIRGLDDKWINLKKQNEINIPQIPSGHYVLEVKALQQGEYLWSHPASFTFTIEPAWYTYWWVKLLTLTGVCGIVWLIVVLNTKRLIKEKQKLEQVINERTSEIIKQKEEIILQKDAITEKNQALEERRNALELALKEIHTKSHQLEVLNATKDKFFSIIAHDIKGPLNSLTGFSDLLIANINSLSQQEILTIAKNLNAAVKNTYVLTENLLTWARAQMNTLESNPQQVNLKELIENTINILRPSANAKHLTLHLEINPEHQVYADMDQLRFIVRNLISNAIKFTPKQGFISIHSSEETHFIHICVSDNGVGIPEENLNKIFSIDSKSTTTGTEGEKGTGLGLLLCKEFAEKNKGKIWAESKYAKGSKFFLSLQNANQTKQDWLKTSGLLKN
jgi:signal transduction histidine kinase/ligand-binding sensor domain-containing protein